MADEIISELARFNKAAAEVAEVYERKGHAYKCLGGNATVTIGHEAIIDTAALLKTYIVVTNHMHETMKLQKREIDLALRQYQDAELARVTAQNTIDRCNDVMDALGEAKLSTVIGIWWSLRSMRRATDGGR